MNRRHLGDALDHWKGSMFRWLQPRHLRVIPMFTDDTPSSRWTEAHLSFYADLLSVTPDHILKPHQRFEHASRKQYFDSICATSDADLFFDPDTGIAQRNRARDQHVAPEELAEFLPGDSDRAVLVYQHRFRKPNFVAATLTTLAHCPSLNGVCGFGYSAGEVALVVLTRSAARLAGLQSALKGLPNDCTRVVTLHDVSPSCP